MNHEAWSLPPIILVMSLLVFGWVLYFHTLVSEKAVEMSLRPHHQHCPSSDDYRCSLAEMALATGIVFDKNETVSGCIFVEENKRFPWTYLFTGEGDKKTLILLLQNMSNDTHKIVELFVEQCNNDREASSLNCYVTFQNTVSLNTITHNESVITVCPLTSNINATTEKLAPNRTCFLVGKEVNRIDIVDIPSSGHIVDLKSIGNKSENTSNGNLVFIRECSEHHSCYKTHNTLLSVIPENLLNDSKTMRNDRKISCFMFKEINSSGNRYSYRNSNSSPYRKQLVNELPHSHINFTRIHKNSKSVRSAMEFVEKLVSKDKLYSPFTVSRRDSHKKQLADGLADLHINFTHVDNSSKTTRNARKISFLEFRNELISRGILHSDIMSDIDYHKNMLLNRLTHLQTNCTRVHNGSVVDLASFEENISDKDVEVGREKYKREAKTETETDASLSEYFDSVFDVFINIAKYNLHGPKKGKIKIPDSVVTFQNFDGEKTLKALDGWLVGADSLHRKRSSKIFKNGNTFHISIELMFDELKFGYNFFESDLPFWQPRGKLQGVIPRTKMEITMDVTFLDGTDCRATIGKGEVTELKDVNVEVNGIGFYTNLGSRVASRVLQRLKNKVRKLVSSHVVAAMQKAMTPFPCGLFTTEILMNIEQ